MRYSKKQINNALSYWKHQEKEFMLQEAIDAESDEKASLTEPDVDTPVQTTEPELDEADELDETNVPMQSEEDFFGKIDDPINDVPPIEKKAEEKNKEKKPEDTPVPEVVNEGFIDKLLGKKYEPNTVGALMQLFNKKYKPEDALRFSVHPDGKNIRGANDKTGEAGKVPVMLIGAKKMGHVVFLDLGFGDPD